MCQSLAIVPVKITCCYDFHSRNWKSSSVGATCINEMSLNNQLATLVYMSEYTSGLKITFSYYHDVFPHILFYVKLIYLNPKFMSVIL